MRSQRVKCHYQHVRISYPRRAIREHVCGRREWLYWWKISLPHEWDFPLCEGRLLVNAAYSGMIPISGANSHGKCCRSCRPLGRSLPEEPPATSTHPLGCCPRFASGSAARCEGSLNPLLKRKTPESAGRSGRRLRELGGPLHQATIRGCVYPQLKLRFSNDVR